MDHYLASYIGQGWSKKKKKARIHLYSLEFKQRNNTTMSNIEYGTYLGTKLLQL